MTASPQRSERTTLALIIAFYVGTLTLAFALEWAGVQVFGLVMGRNPGRIVGPLSIVVGISLMVLGWVLAWSLWPRVPAFAAPGMELRAKDHPTLFRELERVAAMTGGGTVHHVYLLEGIELYVEEFGGIFGFRGKRVIGIGIALLSTLTVSELRSLLSHEFGHFAGGDTRVSLWAAHGRSALRQTIANLESLYGHASEHFALATVPLRVLLYPFDWYAGFLLRFTMSGARARELAADAMAVRLEGSSTFIDGFNKFTDVAATYPSFFDAVVLPHLKRGTVPPIAQALREYMTTPDARTSCLAARRERLERRGDVLDTHPPPSERLALAQRLAVRPRARDDRHATDLMGDLAATELALAQQWVTGATLRRVPLTANAEV